MMVRRVLRGFAPVFYGLGLYSIYVFTGNLGLKFQSVSGFASFVWPPAGIAVASLYLLGTRRYAPVIFAGAFTVNVINGAPVLSALGMGLGNCCEALVGVGLLRAFRFHPTLDRMRDVVQLSVAGVLSSLVGATFGTLSLWARGVVISEELALVWRAWWVGDVLGIMLFSSLIFAWSGVSFSRMLSVKQVFEIVLLLVLVVLFSVFVFLGFSDVNAGRSPLSYTLFPLVLWAAISFGQVAATSVATIISVFASYGTVLAVGPFYLGIQKEDLFFSQTYAGVITLTGMLISAIMAERKEALKIRDDFMSVASHELRTPITTMKLHLQLRKRKTQDEAAQKMLDTDERQVNRLTRLIDEMLDVSKINAGMLTLSPEFLDLKDVVTEVVARYALQFHASETSLRVTNADSVHGMWDRLRMEQVLENLLTNAVKYGGGSPVEVSLLKSGSSAVLSVRDRGAGISADDRERVFEKFERAVEKHSAQLGLGLGLFIVKKIVEAHGGHIELLSAVGEGSTFTVRLPIDFA